MLLLPARIATAAEVKRETGVTEKRLRRLIRLGLPFRRGIQGRRGDAARFDLEEVRRWSRWAKPWRRRKPPLLSPDPRPGVIYAIIDPRSSRPRYVGKAGNDVSERWREHRRLLIAGKHPNCHLQRWFNQLAGLQPEFVILQECLPHTLDQCEQEWIARGRSKGWKLCNIAEGGIGGPRDQATRQKLREISKRNWGSPEYQERHEAHRAARKGMTVDQYREHRQKKATERGRNREQWRQNMAIAARRAAEHSARRATRRDHLPVVPITMAGVALVRLTNNKWAKVDIADWTRVSHHRWSANQKAGRNSFRVKTNVDGECVLLNRFVAQAQGGDVVRHQNGDQFDCTRRNLIIERPRNSHQNGPFLGQKRADSGQKTRCHIGGEVLPTAGPTDG